VTVAALAVAPAGCAPLKERRQTTAKRAGTGGDAENDPL
jgi:hypothetical protein